jgi:hypothetical protein
MAMITLDFKIDEAAFATDGRYSPATASQAALEETYFLTPFRFCVDGVELLGVHGRQPATLGLPLLGFASHVHQVVAATRPGKRKRCYLAGGGDLTFERRANLMHVSSSLTGAAVTVDAGELLQAVRSLLENVRNLLLKRFPDMQAHPAWGSWFST